MIVGYAIVSYVLVEKRLALLDGRRAVPLSQPGLQFCTLDKTLENSLL